MTLIRSTLAASALALLGLPGVAGAQTFPATGNSVLIDFTGAAYDLVIPSVNPPAMVRLEVKGGDGGDAVAGPSNQCTASGGDGRLVTTTFLVGNGVNELTPGGTLRFVVGGKGGNDDQNDRAAASGGGGSGVLYAPSGSSAFVPLIIAGGGGGAFQEWNNQLTGCATPENGANAQGDGCGSQGGDFGGKLVGGDGGCNGVGGYAGKDSCGSGLWCPKNGGGGGYVGDGESASFGPTGGRACGLFGGAGGSSPGHPSGGFGCGGGGAAISGGGGGGGFSGGGGGAALRAGGGGGSFAATNLASGPIGFGWDTSAENGYARLTALPAPAGDVCADAIPIPSTSQTSYTEMLVGTTDGALSFGGCDVYIGNGPDVWYGFANTSSCARTLTIQSTIPGFSVINTIEEFTSCGGSAIGCGVLNPNAPDYVAVVPGGETRLFRIGGLALGAAYSIQVDIVTGGADVDGDGVLDCMDNCSLPNPDQADADGDGVGDLCDVCPGFDDHQDADGDGVPDACDLCPGSDDALDSDFDGVPDGCDTCMGDDSLDTDGDGLPDECDPTPYSPDAIDCDGNQFADDDTDYESRHESFSGVLDGGGPSPVFYTLNANPATHPAITQGAMRLAESGVPNQLASMIFAPVTQLPTGFIKAHFDFRMGPGTGGGADGLSFSLLDPAVHGPDALFGEKGARNASLDVSFDTYQNVGDLSDNFVEVAYDGVVLGQFPTSFDLEDATWLRVELIVSPSGVLSLQLFVLEPTFIFEPVVSALQIPGWQPKAWLYGFGTRCGAATNQVLVDNVLFLALDDVGDCNHDGVPDACEQTWSELGPETSLPGTGGVTPLLTGLGDLCSGNWTLVSLSQARPSSLAYLFIGLAQLSAPFKGGLLVPTPDISVAVPTGTGGFDLGFPWFDGLPSGFSVWWQVWVVDPAGPLGASASNGLVLTTP